MAELETLAKELNAYISFQRNRSVKESAVEYEIRLPNEPSD